MTTIDLDEAQRLCAAASSGPWEHGADDVPPDEAIMHDGCVVASVHPYANDRTVLSRGEDFSRADARFIAFSRSFVPLAVARIRAVQKVLEDAGCSCDCEHHYTEHGDDCERCLGCRVEAALRGGR